MSIKRKLIFILAVVGMLLFFLTGYTVWNVRQVSRQVETVGPGIEYLHEAGDIRLRFYRQMQALLHYYRYHEEDAKKEFETLKTEIGQTFPRLEAAVRLARRGGDKEERDLANIKKIEKGYGDIVTVVDRSFRQRQAGRFDDSRRLIKEQVELPKGDVFLKEISDAVVGEADEITSAYHEMVVRLGAMPWAAHKSLKQIEGAQLSIRYFLAVDRLSLSLNRQLNEVIEHIATGQERDRREAVEAGYDVESALKGCRRIIGAQIDLGMEGEEQQSRDMDELDHAYKKISDIADLIYAAKRSGRDRAAFTLMEDRLKPLIDSEALPKLEHIMNESRGEIAAVHRTLLKSVYLSGILSVTAITTVAVTLFLLTSRELRRMVRAIDVLSAGADIIGRGNLDHTISVDTNDELDGLAMSFNKMTASLKDSDDDLRSFIYGLSHDLRSPLVNIKGFSGELAQVLKELDGLLDRASAGLPEEDRKRLQAILENEIPATLTFIGGAAEKINELVNAVLKLARVGQMDLKPENLDMTALIRSGLGRFEEEIGRRNIAVNIDVLPAVAADRIAMQEIVANILDNAIKYLSPDRPGLVEISGQRNAGESLFHFRDNGRGIAKPDLPKIFGIFRRAGEQDISGDGIGLTYVKALVRRHGGRIWCESEAGAGTTFSFSIPDGTALSG